MPMRLSILHYLPLLRFRQGGQGLAEYALILALIAILAVVALAFLGGAVNGALSRVGKSI
jgi:Flp pilus assembly pilin Flp